MSVSVAEAVNCGLDCGVTSGEVRSMLMAESVKLMSEGMVEGERWAGPCRRGVWGRVVVGSWWTEVMATRMRRVARWTRAHQINLVSFIADRSTEKESKGRDMLEKGSVFVIMKCWLMVAGKSLHLDALRKELTMSLSLTSSPSWVIFLSLTISGSSTMRYNPLTETQTEVFFSSDFESFTFPPYTL